MFTDLVRATCACLLLIAASESHAEDLSTRIGVYHWNGQQTRSMSEGVERIASLGGRVARLAYTPRYYTDYGVGFGCYPNYSLSALAREPDIRRALEQPGLDVIILTTYDGTSFGDCRTHNYLRRAFYTAEHTAAIEAEYSDFVLLLFERYGGTHRRFIISNWESDNAIYCGAAFAYIHDPAFRRYCDTNYRLFYAGNDDPRDSLEGLRLWFTARASGIARGVARAHARGLGGVEVVHAPEISAVRMLETRGLPGVLERVLAPMRPAYVSYSAYESITGEDPGGTLAADIRRIRELTGASGIIIGEAGYARSIWKESALDRMTASLEAATTSGAAYFICWNLNDHQDANNNFGLFDTQGAITPTGTLVETWLHPRRRQTQSGGPAQAKPPPYN
jgi:hypothetical protein